MATHYLNAHRIKNIIAAHFAIPGISEVTVTFYYDPSGNLKAKVIVTDKNDEPLEWVHTGPSEKSYWGAEEATSE